MQGPACRRPCGWSRVSEEAGGGGEPGAALLGLCRLRQAFEFYLSGLGSCWRILNRG